ncbi:MAG: thioredoxin fold domain-containing protein [Hydrogenothermaceae bacterium]
MRKIVLTVVLMIAVSLFSCNQSKEPKFTVDPNSVIKPAMENKKNLIVVFESETCQYCEKLNKDLKDLQLKESLLKNNIDIAIVNVEGKRQVIDPESKKVMDEQTLTSIYRVTGYPTIAVFLPEKDYELFGIIPGYLPKDYFIKLADYIGTKCYDRVKSFQEYIDKGGKC